MIGIALSILLAGSSFAHKDFNGKGLAAAMKKVKCETVDGAKTAALTLQEGKNATALNEPEERLETFRDHKVGAFYYRDDSLGLVVDGTTSTFYNVSKLSPNLLAFLSLKDGTELKCYSHPVYGAKAGI